MPSTRQAALVLASTLALSSCKHVVTTYHCECRLVVRDDNGDSVDDIDLDYSSMRNDRRFEEYEEETCPALCEAEEIDEDQTADCYAFCGSDTKSG